MTESRAPARPPKKSESVEVRLPYETKLAFLAACQAEQRTASDVIRAAIEDYLAAQAEPQQPDAAPSNIVSMIPQALRKKRYLAAGAAGAIGLAALVAMPSAAAPSRSSQDKAAAFANLDRNGDGVVTYEEFVQSDKPEKK